MPYISVVKSSNAQPTYMHVFSIPTKNDFIGRHKSADEKPTQLRAMHTRGEHMTHVQHEARLAHSTTNMHEAKL